MTAEGVAKLEEGVEAHPVQIRVLRKWTPQLQPYITCYILVDKFGVAIQAIAYGANEQKFTDAALKINKCYQLDNYSCMKPLKYIHILKHTTNMRIGASTIIIPIEDMPEIPHFYFMFGDYQKLREICDKKAETTDYCGILEGPIEDKNKRDGDPFVSFNLIDISNELVPVTLWKEISTEKNRFDRDAIERAPKPAIIALTSVKVITYSKRPQLQSTSNTFIFLNPQIPEKEALLNRLKAADFEPISQHLQTTTIADLLEKPASELQGKTFLCDAKIQQITSEVDWYRNICPTCSHEILRYGKNWMCPTDGRSETAIYRYQITAILEDNTGKMEVTINDEAATTIIGIECSQLRITSASKPDYAIPTEITSIKGKAMTFHLETYRGQRTVKLKVNVQKVTNIQVEPTLTDTPATTSTQQTPAPATPQTIQKTSTAAKRLDFTSEDDTTAADNSKRPKTIDK